MDITLPDPNDPGLPKVVPGHLLWVEGIVGAGKTTFCRNIGPLLNLRVIEEPVATNPYLKRFYQDPKKYAFPMQICLLALRAKMQQLAMWEASGVGRYNGAMLDRSLSGDRVFAKQHARNGNISRLDWWTYEQAYDAFCRPIAPPVRLIYLIVDPECALERIQRRKVEDPENRACESAITLDYLKSLRDGYDELMEEAEHGLLPWGNAVKINRMHWDPMGGEPRWDLIARSLQVECQLHAKQKQVTTLLI